MKKIMLMVAVAASFSLAGCDKIKELTGKSDAPAAKPGASPAAKTEAPKPKVNQPIEDAMSQIPPELREPFQEALKCEVKRNQAKGETKAINITPEYIGNLLNRLKADASIAKC